jgi:hypothetical protein
VTNAGGFGFGTVFEVKMQLAVLRTLGHNARASKNEGQASYEATCGCIASKDTSERFPLKNVNNGFPVTCGA